MHIEISRMVRWRCTQIVCWLFCIALSLTGWHTAEAVQSGEFVASVESTAAPSEVQRQEIDTLLKLINQRLAVAEKVAQAKWNSGAPIDDPAREHKILADLAADIHDESDADRVFTLRFFQAQFDAGKIIQRQLHGQWQSQQRPAFAQAPDLARDIRPELDRLTPLLINSLRQVRALLIQPAIRDYLALRAQQLIALHRIDIGAARAEAVRVLLLS